MNPFKHRKLITVVLATVAAIGIYIGSQLPDFKLGAGGGGGLGLTDANPQTSLVPSDSHPATPEDQKNKKVETGAGVRKDVLDVVIDGSGYALRDRDEKRDELQPVKLTDVVAMARQAPGNRDGIRVRVYRKETAMPKAEEDLQQALEEAGLSETSVQMIDGVLK